MRQFFGCTLNVRTTAINSDKQRTAMESVNQI